MQFLTILKIFLSLIPLISEAVKTVEAALPFNGVGQQKLEMVRQTLDASYKAASDMTVPFEALWNLAQPLITSMVAVYNATGAFPRSDAK
jgi:hypothetical protein